MLNILINITYIVLLGYFFYHKFYSGILALMTIGSFLYSSVLNMIGITSGHLPLRYILISALIIFTIYENKEIIKVYNYKIIAMLIGFLVLITFTNLIVENPVSVLSPHYVRNIYLYTFIPAILFSYLLFVNYDIEKLLIALASIGLLTIFFLISNFSLSLFLQLGREFFSDVTMLDTISTSRLVAIPFVVSVIYMWDQERVKWLRLISAGVAILCVILILALGQRATVLGLSASLIAFYMFTNAGILKKLTNLTLVGCIIGMTIFLIGTENLFIIDRFMLVNSQYIQNTERFMDYFNTWELAKSNYFILGAGTEGYSYFTNQLREYPHSIILESFADYGLLGLILILSIISYSLYYSVFIFRYGLNTEKAVPMIFIVIFVSALFSGSFATNHLFFTFAGIISPVYTRIRTRIE